jgi:signal transduction histidine kinase
MGVFRLAADGATPDSIRSHQKKEYSMPSAQPIPPWFVVLAAVIFLFWLFLMIIFFLVFRVWFQAKMSGVPLSVSDILGMKLRKINVKAVLRALVLAKQAGVTIPRRELELAYLQGVDLQKLTLAMIEAKRQNREITSSEAVEAELKNRPAEERETGRDERRRHKDERRRRKDER